MNKEEIIENFEIDESELKDCEILTAAYTYESYEGDVFVLFKKDGKLFEVNGGHCSCYGLEGQWSPEETTKEELLHRLNKGESYHTAFKECEKEIREALGEVA